MIDRHFPTGQPTTSSGFNIMDTGIEEPGKDLLKVINDSRFFLFLGISIYIGITVVSTTDEMLIRQSQVKLPLLDAQIPVSSYLGFHIIAPWLVVLLHGNLLLELALLEMGKKLQFFKQSVKQSFQSIEFIVFRSILFLILIILPLSILLLIQGRFLVLHDEIFTWIQRLAIVADLILLWLLWPGVGWDYDQVEAQKAVMWKRLPKQRFLLVVAMCSVLLMTLMRIPGDQKPEKQWPLSSLSENHPLNSLANWWFQWRNLDLREKVVVTTQLKEPLIDKLRIQKIEEEDFQQIPTNYFQGANMTYANLVQAILPRVDFRAAHRGKYPTQLQGANLSYAKLPGALSDQANLQNANLQGAWLPRAELRRARLQDANLTETILQNAILQAACLQNTKLQNAKLHNAYLQGANLSGAQLQGAILRGAQLQGAILHGANLQDADLTHTNLQGADLTEAKLDGARLNQTELEETLLDESIILRKVTSNQGTQSDLRQLEHFNWNLTTHEKTSITLMDLACSSEYIAQGLVQQTLNSSPDPRRASWAIELKKKIDSQGSLKPEDCLKADPSCPGICNLPENVKKSLSDPRLLINLCS